MGLPSPGTCTAPGAVPSEGMSEGRDSSSGGPSRRIPRRSLCGDSAYSVAKKAARPASVKCSSCGPGTARISSCASPSRAEILVGRGPAASTPRAARSRSSPRSSRRDGSPGSGCARPPSTARYARKPRDNAESLSRPAARSWWGPLPWSLWPSTLSSSSPPPTATCAAASSSSSSPPSVTSMPAAEGAFPTRTLAAARDGRSMAPPAGTPDAAIPWRGPPCTLLNGPGASTRAIGVPAGRAPGASSGNRPSEEGSTGSKITRSPGCSRAGGVAVGSKSRVATRPISRHPPGVAAG